MSQFTRFRAYAAQPQGNKARAKTAGEDEREDIL